MKKLALLILISLTTMCLSGCLGEEESKALEKERISKNEGLSRRIEVIGYDNEVLRTYEGNIYISESSENRIVFDYDGNRINIYNLGIIVEEY